MQHAEILSKQKKLRSISHPANIVYRRTPKLHMSQAASYPCLMRTYKTKSVKNFSYIKKTPKPIPLQSLRKDKSIPG